MSAGHDPEVGTAVEPIGGFFGLDLEQAPLAADSVWDAWTHPFNTVSTFGIARAALEAVFKATASRRVWLPAYFCREATHALESVAAAIGAKVRTYGLTDELEPDVEQLGPQLASGDLVVVVDYFGWPPSLKFRDWTESRPDVVWVEDRAQTLWTAEPPWAAWCVYSPRKLLGTPNGGILLGKTLVSLESADNAPDLTVGLPELMRFEDVSQGQNDRWYAAYQAREAAFAQTPGVMSQLTSSLLRRVPIAPLVRARQTNYAYLLGRLRSLAAWPRSEANTAPFGLVITVEDASALARQLAEQRLFCARHWADLGSDPAAFPFEHRLSRQLVTLPCDHRYSPPVLERLVDAIERLAPAPGSLSRVCP